MVIGPGQNISPIMVYTRISLKKNKDKEEK
jgi:hypothetical protein